ncbi:MAG TPA: fibronectin type III domain-containing protein, partial [Chitinophagaceae bacterium]|nr:fibronectin type III domain-containing protein [Chitinophagaceae bacterium]
MILRILFACLLATATTVLYSQTPVVNAKKRTATITIDGNPSESIWEFTNNVTKPIVGTPNNTVTFAVLWDSLNLYVAVKVTDANKFNDSPNPWDDDAAEVYIDAENNGGTAYGPNDRQFVKGWNDAAIWEKTSKTTGIQHAWANITNGYAIEFLIPWSNIAITNPQTGFTIGFDVAVDDDDNGTARESQQMWAGDNDNWQYPRNFGDLVLVLADSQAPTAPTNLAASTITQSSLTLTWTASTDNVAVTGYDIYQNNVKINSSPVTTTNYNVTGLTAATAYQFFVRARDAAGNISANSNTINITTPDTQAPTAPTNVTASAVTQTSLTLSWTSSTDNVGVTGYDIYQNSVKINSALVTATTYAVTGLIGNTSYAFVIQARDAAGNSANSSTLNVTTLPPPDTQAPTAPSNVTASNIAQNSLTLSWTASTDNVAVTGYDIYQNGVKVNTSLVTTTSYTANGLSALTDYDFYVVAKDAAGNTSAASNTASVTTPDTQAPSAPTGLSASNIAATSLTLNWNASTDNTNVAGYDVYQNSIKINSAPVTTTTFNVTGLTQGTSYSFFVKAFDGSGNISANSSTVNVTTIDTQAPSAPGGLSSSNLTSTSLTLSWTASTDNIGVTGYDVYRNAVKINGSVVTTTSYNVTGLTASTAYSFFVQARDAAGNISANSNTLNVTTPAQQGCTGTGAINFQKWLNITGTAVSNLTSNANYPNNPSSSGTLTSFEIPSNSADNYGMKVYGYICPPTTGSYTFWIASDDNSELWLSTNSSAGNKVKIAYQTSWTNSREWNKFATQKSAAITLIAGQLYYVEALMKDGSQGDNMAVGWAKPGQATTAPSEVIPGTQLVAQIPDTQAPTAPSNLSATNIGQITLTLNWTAATDNIGVTGYDVYRNGTKINSSLVSATTYNVTSLAASTAYSFYVIAKDAAGNSSVASATINATTLDVAPGGETFTMRTVIANQRMPHDLVYGPDNNIWYTERFAGRVNFVNPATGVKTNVLSLGSNFVNVGGQDGLLGLALH